MSRCTSRKGFTLVELLVVVLILAILTAIALPLYLGAISNSELRTARANMQTIANAEQAFKLKNSAHVYTSVLSDLSDDLGNNGAISGPGSRRYSVTLNNSATTATCTGINGFTANVPPGGFQVQSDVTSDGCYVPGVTTE